MDPKSHVDDPSRSPVVDDSETSSPNADSSSPPAPDESLPRPATRSEVGSQASGQADLPPEMRRPSSGPGPGTILQSRYRILEVLASGGMGVVFRGERVDLGRAVAIKFLRAPFAANPGALKRFEREALTMSKLSHPNCVSVIDIGVHEGMPYIVMDFVSGQNLKQVIEATGPMIPGRAIHIVRQILRASSHAHSQGLVHRDIKPANIMLSDAAGTADHVLVLDFGLAKFHRDTFGNKLTASDIVLGTPAYMSPEQTRSSDVGPATDIYSTGVVLFELVTGEKPYPQPKPLDVVRMHRDAPIPSARQRLLEVAARSAAAAAVAWELSPDLDEVLRMAMAKDPEQRFASAAAFAEALNVLPEAQTYAPRMATGHDGRADTPWPARRDSMNDVQRAVGTAATVNLSAGDLMPISSSGMAVQEARDNTNLDATNETLHSLSGDQAADAASPIASPMASQAAALDPSASDASASPLVIQSTRMAKESSRGPNEPTLMADDKQSTAPDRTTLDPSPTTGYARTIAPVKRRQYTAPLIVLVACVALLVVLIVLPDGEHADRDDGDEASDPVATIADAGVTARDAAAIQTPNTVHPAVEVKEVDDIERLLEKGLTEQAIEGIAILHGRSTHKNNAYLYLLEGHAYFKLGRYAEGLESYDSAIRFKPAYRTRSSVSTNAIEALGREDTRAQAEALFKNRIKRAGLSELLRAANKHEDPEVRKRAAALAQRWR